MIKGNMVELVPATLDQRQKAYEWCFCSETTKSHSGPPDYPENPILTYEEFCEKGYEDYYFTGEKPQSGRGFFIAVGGEHIGFISYSCFHLKAGIAELDNWISREENCGKGFGTDAIIALGNYLHETMGIHTLIMGPSAKNTRAIRAYEKAGLIKTNQNMRNFLLPEYIAVYGDGDYGEEQTAVCVKVF
ncbi:GNAT family N-acetyltransferase [Clostridia bacterium OttesenSCG-928-F22]|nr:GNAT family N-acetyltransferase [Clostridia bacterium OttesenSCG-928-F22]